MSLEATIYEAANREMLTSYRAPTWDQLPEEQKTRWTRAIKSAHLQADCTIGTRCHCRPDLPTYHETAQAD